MARGVRADAVTDISGGSRMTAVSTPAFAFRPPSETLTPSPSPAHLEGSWGDGYTAQLCRVKL